MDVHPTKNGIFIGIDPYPYMKKYGKMIIWKLENDAQIIWENDDLDEENDG